MNITVTGFNIQSTEEGVAISQAIPGSCFEVSVVQIGWVELPLFIELLKTSLTEHIEGGIHG